MGKILIVDDDASCLRRTEDFLKVYAEDLEILTALNGQQTLQILNTYKLDLVVTDLQISGMDGFEFLTHINSKHPTISVIVLIEFNTLEIQKRLDRIGHFHHLEKPVQLDILGYKILSVLKESSKTYVQGFSLANFVQLCEKVEGESVCL